MNAMYKQTKVACVILVSLGATLLFLYCNYQWMVPMENTSIVTISLENKLIIHQKNTTFKKPNPLIFTIVNSGFINFAKSWLLHLQSMTNIVNYMVVCTDNKCYEQLIASNFSENHVLLFEMKELSQEMVDFKSPKYSQYTKQRPYIIKTIYDKYYDKLQYDALLYIDADAMIIEDFIFWFYYEKSYISFDIVLQNDGIVEEQCKDNGIHGKYIKNICTCFIFIPFNNEHHKRVYHFIEDWLSFTVSQDQYWANQIALNKVIDNNYTLYDDQHTFIGYDTNKLNIGFVDCYHFPPGSFFTRKWYQKLINWDTDFMKRIKDKHDHSVKWIHANFVVGAHKKIEMLNSVNHWCLDSSDMKA